MSSIDHAISSPTQNPRQGVSAEAVPRRRGRRLVPTATKNLPGIHLDLRTGPLTVHSHD